MFSIEVITLSLVIFINLIILWVLATQSSKTAVNRLFITAVFFVVLWALGTAVFLAAPSLQLAHLGLVLFYLAPMFVIMFLSFFASVFPERNGKPLTLPNIGLSIVTVTYAALVIFMPQLLTDSIELQAGGHNILHVHPLGYSIYTAYFNVAFLITFSIFYLQMRRYHGQERKQLVSIFIGTFLAAMFSLATNLFMPIFGNSQYIWLGPTWTLFYVITVTVSIVKHQLFDIKLAAVRSVAYVGVLLTLSALYYIFAYLLSISLLEVQMSDAAGVGWVNISLALLLAFIFQPVKHFFDKITDDIFYRDRYKTDEFFARMSELLASSTGLRGLLERAAYEITDTLKTEQTFFFVYYTDGTPHYMSAGTPQHTRMPLADAHMLDKYAKDYDQVILTETLPENAKIRPILISHKIELLMPLISGGRIVGYVCLGERRSGRYTQRDLKVLATIADELVIAIQNALSVQEVKEINATLQQRIDVATKELRESNAQLHRLDTAKDEFVSMASHQLRTPLTSIKGYISMLLDGDAGKLTETQQKLLGEAYNSSERMVGLIGDFLSVSRVQTGRFTIETQQTDLLQIVQQEVNNLQSMARAHDLTLSLAAPQRPLLVLLDVEKVRQIIMNFIDNAVYYSHAGGEIAVELRVEDDDVVFTVKDSGIGVPKKEQDKLFSKFYRASNARKQRPDGTGVGLYLAKKVIAGHRGKLVFVSEEGKGSTFGFSLPLLVSLADNKVDNADN